MRAPAVAAEALAGEGLIHHAVDRLARSQQGDQRSPGGHAADEGFGPIDGVEDPDVFRVGAFLAEFLTDDAMVGEGAADERPHRRFGRVVGGGDGIKSAGAAFVLDAQRRAEERQDGLARDRGKLVDESRKVDRSHAAPPHRRRQWRYPRAVRPATPTRVPRRPIRPETRSRSPSAASRPNRATPYRRRSLLGTSPDGKAISF